MKLEFILSVWAWHQMVLTVCSWLRSFMSEGERVNRCGLRETNLMYSGTQSSVIGRKTPRKQNRHNLSGP